MYRKIVFFLIICSLGMLTSCSEDPKGKIISPVPLVDTLSNGDTFQFRNLEWFINEDELLKRENINKDDIVVTPAGVIVNPQTILFKEVDLEVELILYTFHDDPNMLVSGAYWAYFDDEETYLETSNKVTDALNAKFGNLTKKGDGNIEINHINANGDKTWNAEDYSLLSVSFHVDYTDPKPYKIFIKVSAPRDIS